MNSYLSSNLNKLLIYEFGFHYYFGEKSYYNLQLSSHILQESIKNKGKSFELIFNGGTRERLIKKQFFREKIVDEKSYDYDKTTLSYYDYLHFAERWNEKFSGFEFKTDLFNIEFDPKIHKERYLNNKIYKNVRTESGIAYFRFNINNNLSSKIYHGSKIVSELGESFYLNNKVISKKLFERLDPKINSEHGTLIEISEQDIFVKTIFHNGEHSNSRISYSAINKNSLPNVEAICGMALLFQDYCEEKGESYTPILTYTFRKKNYEDSSVTYKKNEPYYSVILFNNKNGVISHIIPEPKYKKIHSKLENWN